MYIKKLLVLLAVTGLLALSGCDSDNSIEEAGKTISKSAENAGEVMSEATQDTCDAIGDATDSDVDC